MPQDTPGKFSDSVRESDNNMAGLAGLGVKDFQWMPVSDVKDLKPGSDVLNCQDPPCN